MSDLKPCPFCGGEASMIIEFPDGTAISVGCYSGNCAMEPYTWNPSEAEAIAAWNRRALPAERHLRDIADRVAK